MNEYTWKAKIISGNRITIPDMIVKDWELTVGTIVRVEVKRSTKAIHDMVI